MRRGSRERVRSRARPVGSAAPAGRHRDPGRRRRTRRRPDPRRLRLDDRQDRGLGQRPRRGARPTASGIARNHRGGRRRHYQPLLPADPAQPARGARRAIRQPLAGPADRARRRTCPPRIRLPCWSPPWSRTTSTRPPSGPRSMPARRAAAPSRRPGWATAAASATGASSTTCTSTAPAARTYRVTSGVGSADVTVSHRDGYERRVVVGDRTHRVVSVVEGAMLRVDVDGAAHAVFRDDGGVVRCPGPAFVLSVLVEPGDQVAEGDPLAVVESMKMETTITAPFAGTVASVETAANMQVEAGAPVGAHRDVRHRSGPRRGRRRLRRTGRRRAVRHSPLRAGVRGAALLPARLRPGPRLGAGDADPAVPSSARSLRLPTPTCCAARTACWICSPTSARCTGRAARSSRRRRSSPAAPRSTCCPTCSGWTRTGPVCPTRTGGGWSGRCCATECSGLDRTPELEEAVVWMFRSFRRVADLVPAVTAILERRLRHHAELVHLADAEMRARLDRLAAIQGRQRVVADLARDVRFHYFDEPLLAVTVADEYARARRDLDALRDDPDGAGAGRPDRPPGRPARSRCAPSCCGGGVAARDPGAAPGAAGGLHSPLLPDQATPRFDGQLSTTGGCWVPPTTTSRTEQPIHVVTAYTPLVKLPELSRAIAGHLRHGRPRTAGRGRPRAVAARRARQTSTPSIAEARKTAGRLRLRARCCGGWISP